MSKCSHMWSECVHYKHSTVNGGKKILGSVVIFQDVRGSDLLWMFSSQRFKSKLLVVISLWSWVPTGTSEGASSNLWWNEGQEPSLSSVCTAIRLSLLVKAHTHILGGVGLCCSFTQSDFRHLLAHVPWGRGSRMLCNRMESQELMLIFGNLLPLLCVPNSCLSGQMSKLQLSSEMHVYVFICMHTYMLVATKGQCQVLSLFLSVLYLM